MCDENKDWKESKTHEMLKTLQILCATEIRRLDKHGGQEKDVKARKNQNTSAHGKKVA